MMSIGREIAWELYAYITEHGLDGAGPFITTRESMHSSAVHATEMQCNARFMNRRIEWPSSTLHALSMRTAAFLHFIKSRSASTSFTANIQVRHLFPINTIHIKHSIKVNIIVGKYPVFILSIHYMNFSFYWTTCYRSERWIQESGHVTRWGVSKASHMITCTISSHVHHIPLWTSGTKCLYCVSNLSNLCLKLLKKISIWSQTCLGQNVSIWSQFETFLTFET